MEVFWPRWAVALGLSEESWTGAGGEVMLDAVVGRDCGDGFGGLDMGMLNKVVWVNGGLR